MLWSLPGAKMAWRSNTLVPRPLSKKKKKIRQPGIHCLSWDVELFAEKPGDPVNLHSFEIGFIIATYSFQVMCTVYGSSCQLPLCCTMAA